MPLGKPQVSSRAPFTGYTATTATSNITLVAGTSNKWQQVTCSGGARTVTLPAYANSIGLEYVIANTSATALAITVADAAAVTVCTIGQDETAFLVSNGTAWMATVAPSGSGSGAYALLGADQTFTGINTMSGANVITHANTGLKVLDSGGDHATTIVQNSNEAANRQLNIPALGGTDTIATLGVANTFTATNTFSGALTSTGAVTTTRGISGGTALAVGGSASVRTAAGTALTGSASETVLSSYSIPANTIGLGTVIKYRYQGIITATNGATTLTIRVRLGATTLTGTTLIAGAATATGANLIYSGEGVIVGRAAAGAAAACVGNATFYNPTAAGNATANQAITASTNFATNGVLLLEVTGEWNAADANSTRVDIMNVEVVG